jgi:hypothetical protein
LLIPYSPFLHPSYSSLYHIHFGNDYPTIKYPFRDPYPAQLVFVALYHLK